MISAFYIFLFIEGLSAGDVAKFCKESETCNTDDFQCEQDGSLCCADDFSTLQEVCLDNVDTEISAPSTAVVDGMLEPTSDAIVDDTENANRRGLFQRKEEWCVAVEKREWKCPQTENCYQKKGELHDEYCCISMMEHEMSMDLVEECFGVKAMHERRALSEKEDMESHRAEEKDMESRLAFSEKEDKESRHELFLWGKKKDKTKDGLPINHNNAEGHPNCIPKSKAKKCNSYAKACYILKEWHDKKMWPDHYDEYCCIHKEYGFSLALTETCFGHNLKPTMHRRKALNGGRLMKN